MAHPIRRAAVVGAGSFGTAVAVVLERGGVRTTLFTRTAEQARELESSHRNQHYLDTVELPGGLRIRALDSEDGHFRRVDAIFLAVPSGALAEVAQFLSEHDVPTHAGLVSCSKGLVQPDGVAPTVYLERRFGPGRVACPGGAPPPAPRGAGGGGPV